MSLYTWILLIVVVVLADACSFQCLSSSNNNLFLAAHTLLMVLYRRDCRRPYAPDDHWLIKDVKSYFVIGELERGKKPAQVFYILSSCHWIWLPKVFNN